MSYQATKWARGKASTPMGQLVLMLVADHSDKYGVTWVSQQTLANDGSCSLRAVGINLARLKRDGLISRVHRSNQYGHRASDFTILAPLHRDRGPMLDLDEGAAAERGYLLPVRSLARIGDAGPHAHAARGPHADGALGPHAHDAEPTRTSPQSPHAPYAHNQLTEKGPLSTTTSKQACSFSPPPTDADEERVVVADADGLGGQAGQKDLDLDSQDGQLDLSPKHYLELKAAIRRGAGKA